MPRHLGHFELPALDVKRGQGISLLVPDEFYAEDSTLEQIAALLRSEGHIVEIARPARRGRGLSRFLSPRSTDSWFSKEVGIDRQSAQQILSALPIAVDPKLEWNAVTTRNFIGVAAALQRDPDVLIYACVGMEPAGVLALHDLVTSRRQDFFAVYVNWGCNRSRHDADFMSLPYSERKWLKPNEEFQGGDDDAEEAV